ncbi:hypothetical protein ACIOEW_33090 [Streptomyces sp. NPDC087901]|uniref:hypothetical protein n=1 Tax=Streptomyces sp. NPDC087901 TaxID=3365818 RepID=UPI00382A509C
METLGRPFPGIPYDMSGPDAMFGLSSDAHPAELGAEFMTEGPGVDQSAGSAAPNA